MMDEFCHEHSGTCVKLEKLEENVSKLWGKWDSIQTLLIGTLISAVLSLVGVVILLLKTISLFKN